MQIVSSSQHRHPQNFAETKRTRSIGDTGAEISKIQQIIGHIFHHRRSILNHTVTKQEFPLNHEEELKDCMVGRRPIEGRKVTVPGSFESHQNLRSNLSPGACTGEFPLGEIWSTSGDERSVGDRRSR